MILVETDKEIKLDGISIESSQGNDILIYLGSRCMLILSEQTAKWLIQTVSKYVE